MGLLLKNKQAEVKLHSFLQVILLKKYMAKKNLVITAFHIRKNLGLNQLKTIKNYVRIMNIAM